MKLKFMFKDISSASEAWKRMMVALVDHNRISFLVNNDIDLGTLKAASVFQSTDSLREGYKGIYVGAGLGLLAGLMALAFPPWYVKTSWGMILSITTLIGIVTGVLGMGMLGVNLIKTGLERYSKQIDQGGVLMIVDVTEDQIGEICRLVQVKEKQIESALKNDMSPERTCDNSFKFWLLGLSNA
jgi:hypothetical protein